MDYSLLGIQSSKKSKLETDSNVGLNLIQEAAQESPHYNLVMQIQECCRKGWICQLEHIWGEGNNGQTS